MARRTEECYLEGGWESKQLIVRNERGKARDRIMPSICFVNTIRQTMRHLKQLGEGNYIRLAFRKLSTCHILNIGARHSCIIHLAAWFGWFLVAT